MTLSALVKSVLISSLLTLTACGGGGGDTQTGNGIGVITPPTLSSSSSSSSSTVTVDKPGRKISQTLVFFNPQPTDFVGEGGSFTNPAKGKGKGAISYQSSDDSIATVDNQGVVSTISDVCRNNGEVVITANIAADDTYAEASASYTLHITQMMVGEPPAPRPFIKQSVMLNPGETFINQTGTAYNVAASFSSDDPSVATVTGDGVVTALASGSAIITAESRVKTSCYGTVIYRQSYKVTVGSSVVVQPGELNVTAWIGINDTVFEFPESANGYVFYRSSDKNCDFKHVLDCADGKFDVLSDVTFVDATTTLNRKGFYLLANGDSQTSLSPLIAKHIEATAAVVPTLHGKYWRVEQNSHEVFSSTDYINWTLETSTAAFTARTGHTISSHNGRLYLHGGENESGKLDDVWMSTDGIEWRQGFEGTFQLQDN